MRRPFIHALTALAAQDSRILLLTADLGYSVIEPFVERFPDRFFNVGVAEQNLLGMATGLAEAGFFPFVYSIAPFVVLRPLEFIRNGPVRHRLPVRVVGVGGGFEYGPAGYSHHGLEDLAVLRTLPDMVVTAPADYQQAIAILNALWNHPGPVYFRLGKDEQNLLAGLDGRFSLGRTETIGQGATLLFITTGALALETQRAMALLRERGLDSTLLLVACLAPAPSADLRQALTGAQVIVSVEEHVLPGGLGSLVAEVLAESGLARRFLRLGVTARLNGAGGSQEWLRSQHDLSATTIAQRVLTLLEPP